MSLEAIPGTTKLAHLDSLRGLAAIVVVLAHSVGAFYPHAIFGEPYEATSSAELWLREPPMSLLLAGHAAVCLFFILSGYVLSLNILTRPRRPGQLAEAMLKRPVRLGGLVVFTVGLGYVLMLSGALISGTEAGLGATPWLATFWQTTPEIIEFTQDLLFEPFASGMLYNPPLWTIHKELVGSYLVFGFLALSPRLSSRARWLFLLALAVVTFRTLYVGFVIGLAFAQAHSHAHVRRAATAALTWPMLIVGVWLASQLHYLPSDWDGASHGLVVRLAHDFGTGGSGMAGALMIFAAVWLDERFQRVLHSRVLRFFGSISFAMYALHFLLLGSLTWRAYRAVEPTLGHHVAAACVTVGSYAILVVLSVAATRWIDRPSMRLANSFARIVYRIGSQRWSRTTLLAPLRLSGDLLRQISSPPRHEGTRREP